VPSSVTAGATTPLAAAKMASLAAEQGVLVHDATALLSHAPAPAPAASAASTNTSTTYVATDQQTTSAMIAAEARGVPFIAFRGISDTDAVGSLWPFEWLVYQGARGRQRRSRSADMDRPVERTLTSHPC
jgi:hypothetical protein